MSHEQIYDELNAANEASSAGSVQVTYGQALCDPKYKKATMLAIAIAFFNQMTGVNLISIYSTDLFKSFPEGGITPTTGSALVGVAQFVGCLIAPLLGLCMGMKPIFVGGQVAMGLAELGVAICIHNNGTTSTTIFILLFLMCYQATQGSYFWFYVAAVACDTANSIASMVLWGVVLIFATCGSLIINGLGTETTFYIFAGFCIVGALTFIFVMYEIKGLTKEEQQCLYSDVKQSENNNDDDGQALIQNKSVSTV